MNFEVQITNYVNLFFESIPYSEKNAEMKQKIIDTLKEQVLETDFSYIIEHYNTLEKLCLLAGYSVKDMKNLQEQDYLISEKMLVDDFKRTRKSIYSFCISFLFGIVSFYNFCISFHWFYFLLFLCLFGICFKSFLSIRKQNVEKQVFSLEAYQLLKMYHDRYLKKFFNTCFFLVPFFVFFLLELCLLGVNSKFVEILEAINQNLFYVEVLLVLFLKNLFLTFWIQGKLGREKRKQFVTYFQKVSLCLFLYWGIYFIVCLFVQSHFYFLYVCFLFLFLLFYLLFLFRYRYLFTYKNIVLNKKRIFASIMCFVFCFCYHFMTKDFWVLQPYINSVPSLYEGGNIISYDEETGVYSILNQDGGDFKILQLTDIHLGGSIFSYTKDLAALETVYDLISYSNPDFVIVTGDLTFPLGLFSFSFNNHTPVMQFASFMRNIGIPWAFTYGNHDTESISTYSSEALSNLYQSLSYKTSKNLLYPYVQPDIMGRNNQLIEIRNQDSSLNQALFLIDSNAYTGEGFNKYDYIHDDQVEWYKNEVLRLTKREGSPISSMLFFHIPLQEYRTAYQLYESGSDEVTYYFGRNDEKLFDKVCASDYPSKLFDTAVELQSSKAFFCGHDHYNNMSLEYKGIRLTYGMSIDYLAMPGISKDLEQRGGTLITLKEDSTFHIEQIPYEKIKNR